MFDDMKKNLDQTLAVVKDDMMMIKTGRAKPSLIEGVEVEAYPGTWLKLMEVATISAPDSHLLVIQPWDQSVIKHIVTGLNKSEMQLNPVVDGTIVRISIPPLTEERRKDLVKLVKQKIESGKEMMRGVRNDIKKEIEDKEGDAGVSEDDVRRWLDEMQKVYEDYIAKLDELGEHKEAELMEI